MLRSAPRPLVRFSCKKYFRPDGYLFADLQIQTVKKLLHRPVEDEEIRKNLTETGFAEKSLMPAHGRGRTGAQKESQLVLRKRQALAI